MLESNLFGIYLKCLKSFLCCGFCVLTNVVIQNFRSQIFDKSLFLKWTINGEQKLCGAKVF